MRKILRGLISVSDKTGLENFASRLHDLSVELVSTGGTARLLRDAGVPVRDVSDLTGFPEILGGRVKTLHPKVHGGILAIRDDSRHQEQVNENEIGYIDLVVVNLYPFSSTVAKPDVRVGEAIENIDIGGPSMIRSAAKNFEYVAVVVDPADYPAIIRELESNRGELSPATRLRLARRAFEVTAAYDSAIATFLNDSVRLDSESGLAVEKSSRLPARLSINGKRILELRYGENPHQRAALYAIGDAPAGVAGAEQLHGKDLSFNNLIDLNAVWNLATEFEETFCAIVKHTNPCGAALGGSTREAFERALATDPVSAFGGIVGFNRAVTVECAEALSEIFFEVIAAPDYDEDALSVLLRKKNLRVMRMSAPSSSTRFDLRGIDGGVLVQDVDRGRLEAGALRVVTKRPPTEPEMQSLAFAWTVAKHVKSNAIVYARDNQVVGVGAGQMSRVDSVRFGAQKARLALEGCVVASDAFFPFRDGVDEAARTGATAVIQPGGSVRDEEVIRAADEHGLAMAFTGMRHFKH